LLTIALLASRDHSLGRRCRGSRSRCPAIHWPCLWLSDRLGWRASSAAPAAPDPSVIDAALEHAFAKATIRVTSKGTSRPRGSTAPPPTSSGLSQAGGAEAAPRPVVRRGVLRRLRERSRQGAQHVRSAERRQASHARVHRGRDRDLVPAVLNARRQRRAAHALSGPARAATRRGSSCAARAGPGRVFPIARAPTFRRGCRSAGSKRSPGSGRDAQYRIRPFKKSRDQCERAGARAHDSSRPSGRVAPPNFDAEPSRCTFRWRRRGPTRTIWRC
jgi:hypothetical protein